MREILSVHKIGYRLLGMIHGVDSTIMPLHLLEVCLSAVQVYVGLYLTAGLIDLLLAGAYGQAAEWALYLLLVNLLLGTAIVLLKRKDGDKDLAALLRVDAGKSLFAGL